MALQKPKLVYAASVQRRKYIRRFFFSLLAAVAVGGALLALLVAADRRAGGVSPTIYLVGQGVALMMLIIIVLRGLANLWWSLRRRTEQLRFLDKGFVWQRGKQEYKYGWGKLLSIREDTRVIALGKRPVLQFGAHRLVMDDGERFNVTGAYGDTRAFIKAVRKYAAAATGTRMGHMLRDEQPVRIHPRLTVWHGGVEIGKTELSWADIDMQVKNGKLIVYRKDAKGQFKPYKRFNVRRVENLGGFMEVAKTTIRHYQPDRFNIKVQVPHAPAR